MTLDSTVLPGSYDGSGDHGSHDLRGAAGVCAGVVPIECPSEVSLGGVIVPALDCDCSV